MNIPIQYVTIKADSKVFVNGKFAVWRHDYKILKVDSFVRKRRRMKLIAYFATGPYKKRVIQESQVLAWFEDLDFLSTQETLQPEQMY